MIGQQLSEKLLETFYPLARPILGGREVVFRCPFCGDSRKHHESKHFYVKIPQIEGDLPVFYCHLCKVAGIVGSDILKDWGIYDLELLHNVRSYVTEALKLSKNKVFRPHEKLKIINPYPTIDEHSKRKLEYICERTGQNLSFQDMVDLKIVLNMSDLITFNQIEHKGCPKSLANTLDKDGLGFLSFDNAYLNIRNTGNIYDKRWFNYNILGMFDNTRKFYVVPGKADLLSPEPVEFILAEGSFDILSLYLNMFNRDPNKIYVAVGGIGYESVIKYFFKFGFIDAQYRIFSDNDQQRYKFEQLKKNLGQVICDNEIELNYNEYPNEKDFGVPLNQISTITSYI